jgi:hypothetical protein
MAEDKLETREVNLAQWLPWTVLFRGFQVALDLKKLFLAAVGIAVMAFGWWLLAVIFAPGPKPGWPSDYSHTNYLGLKEVKRLPEDQQEAAARLEAWKAFKRDREQWNLRLETAGEPDQVQNTDAGDLANNPQEFKEIDEQIQKGATEIKLKDRTVLVRPKPVGRLRVWPWFEDRGPNPYLLVTGQATSVTAEGEARRVPWERGHFMDWLLGEQLPVLIEPLAKFLRPLAYLRRAGPLAGFYLLLVLVWTVATWAFFGGAITRMAAVQVARNEKIGMGEAMRFVWAKKWSYLFASVAPFLFIGAILVLLGLFGVVNLVPVLGDAWNGFLWPLVLLGGLGIAVGLVGLVGWPMMHATLSAEGSDSFDAISRSYSYVFQGVWQYAFYAVLALLYGAVVVFFVGFMGSLLVYVGKAGVGLTPGSGPQWTDRDPSYLFVYAPTSFGWRELLLQGVTTEQGPLVEPNGVVNNVARQQYLRTFSWYNYVGAGLVTFWTYLFFLMIIGFAYSFFWCESTIIYLLMRRKVDDTELDEVYLEEEEPEETYATSTAVAPGPPPATGTPGLQMVEPPTLRPASPPAPAPAPVGTAAGMGGAGETAIKPAPAAPPPAETRDAPEPPPT